MSPGPESPFKSTAPVVLSSDESELDFPDIPSPDAGFLALVAKERNENLAKARASDPQKEAEREERREERLRNNAKKYSHPQKSNPFVIAQDDSDDDAGERRLTQQTRPTRKASKKALEEMNRETQRMSRNMQLAHQAKTKKNIPKEGLFANFNFKTHTDIAADTTKAARSSATASSAPVSDGEGLQQHETPPTSPANLESFLRKTGDEEKRPTSTSNERTSGMRLDMEEELPTLEHVMTQPVHRKDKGKGKAVAAEPTHPSAPPVTRQRPRFAPRKFKPVRISVPRWVNSVPITSFGSIRAAMGLDIVPNPTTKPKKPDVFDRLPVQKPTDEHSLKTPNALADLASPPKKPKKKPLVNHAEMQAALRQLAREQAAKERAEKLQQLRDRGIIVQTAEERQRDHAEVEDLVDKARREAEEIMKKERTTAMKGKKEEGKETGIRDGLEDTSDEENDEYNEDDADEEGVELSGSGEEDDEDEHRAAKDSRDVDALIDQEASGDVEGDGEKDDQVKEMPSADDEEQLLTLRGCRKSRNTRVIEDDDDEIERNEVKSAVQNPKSIKSVQNPFIPGLPMSDDVPLGLTQAFAATMAGSQTQLDEDAIMMDSLDPERDSLTFPGGMPEPNFPGFEIPMAQKSQDFIKDSQCSQAVSRVEESQDIPRLQEADGRYRPSRFRYDSNIDTQQLPIATQYSELPDPSQDAGFAVSSLPGIHSLEALPSTVDTILLSSVAKDASPTVKKKGRLRRRKDTVPIWSDLEDNNGSPAEDSEDSYTLGGAIRRARAKRAQVGDSFDKKNSEAKKMVEEQAEESEDEYAGLGGASEDESGGEEDEEFKKLIDESDIKVNERELAAFYA